MLTLHLARDSETKVLANALFLKHKPGTKSLKPQLHPPALPTSLCIWFFCLQDFISHLETFSG